MMEKGDEMEIRHYKFDRITFNPEKCFGKACIRGMRMPVSSILAYMGSGMTIEQILEDWPELEREALYQALAYAAAGLEEQIVAIEEPAAR